MRDERLILDLGHKKASHITQIPTHAHLCIRTRAESALFCYRLQTCHRDAFPSCSCTCPSVSSDSKLRVSSLECAAVEDLDSEAVKTGLAQYQAAYASATDDLAKAEAEIGVEVYQAMSYAIADA